MNVFSIDVEEHFQVAALKNEFDTRNWADQDSRVENNTHKLLEILDERGVRGTFFVLGWVADHNPGLIRSIASDGHEIACHGQSHQLIYDQDESVFREETLRSKKTLEDISGVSVKGYRAASYSITAKSLWALDIISEAGFEYDSSIVPARHDLYGLPGAPSAPYRIRLRNGNELSEFPPSTISMMGQRLPVGGGGYFRIFPYWFSRWALRSINNKDAQPFNFYVHPWELDPQQPRVKTNWKSSLRHYVNLDKCEPRLHRLLQDFQFSTMYSVLEGLNMPVVDVDQLQQKS